MRVQLEEAAFRPGSKRGAESSAAALVGLCTCAGGAAWCVFVLLLMRLIGSLVGPPVSAGGCLCRLRKPLCQEPPWNGQQSPSSATPCTESGRAGGGLVPPDQSCLLQLLAWSAPELRGSEGWRGIEEQCIPAFESSPLLSTLRNAFCWRALTSWKLEKVALYLTAVGDSHGLLAWSALLSSGGPGSKICQQSCWLLRPKPFSFELLLQVFFFLLG